MKRALVLSIALLGCDRPAPPRPDSTSPPPAPAAEPQVRAALTAIIDAARAATATCVASEIRWEEDPVNNYYPKYIHPCIPEVCETKPADIERLAAAVKSARAILDADLRLDRPSLRGLVALGEAMAAFGAAILGGKPRSGRAERERWSGLSMHHAALVSAFDEVYPDAKVPVDPPSLTASLAGPEPGGDPCKGWRIPRFCDVSKVHVTSPLGWNAKPTCIAVTTEPRTPARF